MRSVEIHSLSKRYRRYIKKTSMIRNLFSREYETKEAIFDLDLTIEEGEIVGLLGQNGAGKTTLIKMMAGILEPDSGSIDVLGHTPFKKDARFKHLESLVLGQKQQMWWDVSPMDNFELNKAIYSIGDCRFEESVREMSELLGVDALLNAPVRTLSLGERMKCELICALLHEPKIVFLDEPTIGLDVVVQDKIRRFIEGYRRGHRATVILTSHYMEDIERLCDRVVFLDAGRKYFDGTLADFVRTYGSEVVLSIELSGETDFRWDEVGKVVRQDEGTVRIVVDKDEAASIRHRIISVDAVRSIQSSDLDAAEIVRKHFNDRSGREE